MKKRRGRKTKELTSKLGGWEVREDVAVVAVAVAAETVVCLKSVGVAVVVVLDVVDAVGGVDVVVDVDDGGQ